MVKRSKKSKSKRLPLRKKYKIIKKVKEHHRKKAKEAKKLGLNRKRKVEKDPGIPNDWPFKEQELKALETLRSLALEELEQKKAARKERAKQRKLGISVDVEIENDNDESTQPDKHPENPDHHFHKELVKVIDASDVILEVLDARDPLGTRCHDIEKMVVESDTEKRIVLLLNKIDLVPREAVEEWLKYLREERPTVAFKCSTQKQRSNLGWKANRKQANLQVSECLGAETLLKLMKNYSRSHEIKTSVTVGVVGLPNVGKSSLINSLKRCHVSTVGSTPGLTRSMQEVRLDKNVKLLDCPGVVTPGSLSGSASTVLRNCKRIERLEDPVSPVHEIVRMCPVRLLVTLYKLEEFGCADEFLRKVAMVRGKMKKGGIADVEAAARIVLRDWNEGRIPYYTMPSPRQAVDPSDTRIVASGFSKEFDADEVYAAESSFIGSLKPVDAFHPDQLLLPSSSPTGFLFDRNVIRACGMRDDGMGCEGEEVRESNGTRRQNEKLYDADGILNPKIRRAKRKKAKRQRRLP